MGSSTAEAGAQTKAAQAGVAADEKHLKEVKDKIDKGEPLPGEGADEQGQQAEEKPALPPIELEGVGDQLTLKITGDAPDKGTAKMQGGKIDIPRGEYQPGEVVEAVVRMRCTEVSVIDKMNNTTGERVERERVHKFKVMGIEKIGQQG